MVKSKIHRKLMGFLALLAMGGSSFQLSGCDQGIRGGILEGLNGATDTLLLALTEALFTSLDQSGQSDDLTDGLTGGEGTDGTGG